MNEYLNVVVKSTWGAGLVTVNSKYVDKAKNQDKGLCIECNGAKIFVSKEQLLEKKPRDEIYKDKFRGGLTYRLYDFYWKDYINETK